MNKRILILSGPTHEYIDPVRFIGNASSGKMGRAIADEAARLGYTVDLVTGPVAEVNLPALEAGRIHRVVGADEMLATARGLFSEADVVVFAAAVADYAPKEKLVDKMSKSDGELVLHLRPTPDIAQTLCADKRPDQIAVGFALQTNDGEVNARRKLAEKNLDGIVLNTPASLGAADGCFSFLAADSEGFDEWGFIGKSACAVKIFEQVERLIRGR